MSHQVEDFVAFWLAYYLLCMCHIF